MKELIVLLKQILSLVMFFVLLQGCEVDSVKVTQPPFFDLDDFFKKEISRLSDVKEIKKRVTLNGKVEEQTLNDFDLEKDLEVFTDSNINKVAWLDKYTVDSTFNVSNLLEKITYQATEKKLKTQQIIVEYDNQNVKSISITNVTSNQVTDFQQNLKYIPTSGYSMESNQEVTLSTPQKSLVEVEFN